MVIPGEIGFDLNYYAVKLSSIDSTNTFSHFTNGTELTGSVSGITVSGNGTTGSPKSSRLRIVPIESISSDFGI